MKHAAPAAWSMPIQPEGQVVSSFKVTKKLPPGTPGAQKLLQRFGESLFCVRHRVAPGGVWGPASRLWKLSRLTARPLGLSDRVRVLKK